MILTGTFVLKSPHAQILMAITVKLDDLLHARRMSLTGLAGRVDITLANLLILKTGKTKAIRFPTLELICRALECRPGDLLAFEPSDPAARGVVQLPLVPLPEESSGAQNNK